ncbi:MAG: chromate transporter [Ruminococcaceae bacterium]|nr:chromate transporter [Oscillospiraceae bacterium]
MKELINLFWAFFKIGAFTFGGGYAMLPMLQKEVVEKNKWATNDELLDYFAIGQCTPGVIAVNTATFIGYKFKKIRGAIFATLGVICPSIIIIIAIASVLSNFASIPQVQSAFNAISVAVVVLILDAVIKMFKSSVKDLFGLIISVFVFILLLLFNISPVVIVVSAALVGIIKKSIGRKNRI